MIRSCLLFIIYFTNVSNLLIIILRLLSWIMFLRLRCLVSCFLFFAILWILWIVYLIIRFLILWIIYFTFNLTLLTLILTSILGLMTLSLWVLTLFFTLIFRIQFSCFKSPLSTLDSLLQNIIFSYPTTHLISNCSQKVNLKLSQKE